MLGADGSLGGKVEDPLPKDDFVCFFAAVRSVLHVEEYSRRDVHVYTWMRSCGDEPYELSSGLT